MHLLPKLLPLASSTLLFAFSLCFFPRLIIDSGVVEAQESQTREAEADRLLVEGIQNYRQGKFREALEKFQRVLIVFQELGDGVNEWLSLGWIGLVYNSTGNYSQALEIHQQALVLTRQIGYSLGEGGTLNNLGSVYDNLGNYPQAIEYYQQALVIFKAISYSSGEGKTLNNLGLVYNNLGNYPQAIEYYQQALVIFKEIGDLSGEGGTLNNLGLVYDNLGNYPQAIEYYQQALVISQKIGDRSGEGGTLNNLGLAYHSLGKYHQAIEYYQQALVISQELGVRFTEVKIINNFGLVYRNLGKYPQAIEYYQQALVISKEIGDRKGEGRTLNNLGEVYRSLGKYPQALEFHKQALVISQEIGDRLTEARTLNNLGEVYRSLGKYPQALEFHKQALVISQEIGDRAGEGGTLNNLGSVYLQLGNYPQAIENYQQALVIFQEVDDRSTQGTTLYNLGYLFNIQERPELAIIFFKQSVNKFETIRQDNRQLSTELQKSYTDTIASAYRKLADLLLKNDRILEAQRVLDLLKVQELDDYLRGLRGTEDSAQGIYILRPEAEIIAKFNQRQQTAIEIGQELTQLRKIPEAQRTAPQQQRLTELIELETAINSQFNDFIDSDEIWDLVDQLSHNTRRANPDPAQFNALRDNLANIGNAALFYPLILEDRLELVITTPNSPPLRRTVQGVGREELNQAILEFRRALRTYQHPRYRNNAKIQAQKLYQWLIAPIESDLAQANIKTIIYAPDGQLRYIPLTALHDGEKWLIQNYRVNNITAASLTDFDTESAEQPQILAGAFSDEGISYPVQMGDSRSTFSGLPFAGQEVANLVAALPNTISFINQEFSLQAIKPRLNQHNIIHFATHAAFVPTVPEDSFILFGNGDRPTLAEIKNWSLPNVDLVVLSACETGVGGELGNGVEILGLGYQFQRAGARATLASLWKVSDGGTQALMDNFYAVMKQGNSKAEALQKAQIALIKGKLINSDLPPQIQKQLSHPYFWSAFFLIGNGL